MPALVRRQLGQALVCRRSLATLSPAPVSLNNADLVRRLDRDSFLLSFFYPPSLRDAYLAVRAFQLEMERIPDSVSNQSTGLLRYAWWKQALHDCFEGTGTPQQPVLVALRRNLGALSRSRHHFERFLESQRQNFDGPAKPSMAQLAAYSQDTDLQISFIQAKLLSPTSTAPKAMLLRQARAHTVVQLLRQAPSNLPKRRLRFPMDAISPQLPSDRLLYDSGNDGKQSRRTLTESLLQAARTDLNDILSNKSNLAQVRPILLSAVADNRWLERLSREDCDVLSPRLARVDWKLPFNLWWASKTY